MKIKLLLIFITNILFNYKLNNIKNEIINFSLVSLINNSTDKNDNKLYIKYNITNEMPRLFKYIDPLDMYPKININKDLNKYSKTSLASDCYKEISEYSLIIGLLNNYKHYLNFLIRIGCDHISLYISGTICNDALYLVKLLTKRAKLLINERNIKLKECLKLEFDVISLNYKYFKEGKYIGRKKENLKYIEIISIERSFLRKLISEHEKLLTNRLISYELYCILENKDINKHSVIDCERLKSESNILSEILESISRKYLINRLDRNNLDELIYIS